MAKELSGKSLLFARAILEAKPLKISNKTAAMCAGCKESSASASGSRWAAHPDVKAYIKLHWPDYYDDSTDSTNLQTNMAASQTGLPFFDVDAVCAWIAEQQDAKILQCINAAVIAANEACNKIPFTFENVKKWLMKMNSDSDSYSALIQAICQKHGTSTDPFAYWDSVLMNPYSTAKEKDRAAAEKAKYTLAKPAAQSKKEQELERAKKLRDRATTPLFPNLERENLDQLSNKVPVWKVN